MQAAIDLSNRRPNRPTIMVVTSDQAAEVFSASSPNSTARPVEQVIEVLQALGAPAQMSTGATATTKPRTAAIQQIRIGNIRPFTLV